MAPDTDPYGTLGLERGAPLAEVKRAYRRLAKVNHPDAAGEGALPRFLAIQAAYDQIAGPAGRRRAGGASGTGSAGAGPGAGGPAGPRRGWSADPDRAGATYRAYGGRSGRGRSSGTGTGTGAGTGAGATGAGPTRGTGPRRPPRPPNKATLGSTSYDGAEGEPYEPDWGGASWYGTTSGTYWTLNPKEYADPRKHGPEYQMRGRRRRVDPGGIAGPPTDDHRPGSTDADDPTPPVPPTHTATSWWQASTGTPGERTTHEADAPTRARADTRRAEAARASAAATAAAERARSVPPAAGASTTTELSTDPFLAMLRAWLDDARPSPVARVGRAVAGWIPLALAIGWVAGETSGCARFAADCDPMVAPATWLVQIVALGVLVALAIAARIAATAAITTLLAVVPGAILLLATSDPSAIAAGRAALGVLMAAAWVAGLVVGFARVLRRRPVGGRPVS